MKSYRQFCPVARAAEVLAERWTLIIVRNLLMGCRTFSEILEAAPGLPRSLLSQRLATLERYNIVERGDHPSGRGHAYFLTLVGEELWPVCEAMGVWGTRWLDLEREHMEPHLVLWDITKQIQPDQLPPKRVVVRFDLTDRKKRNRFWLVLEPHDSEVCDSNPGFHEDLVLTTDCLSLIQWHMGRLPLRHALKEGTFEIAGTPSLVKRFMTDWQGLSVFSSVEPGERAYA